MPNLRSLGFSPRIIIVWYFIHRSMVQLKLIFVYNARYRLKGLIHCKIRIIIFFQRHLLKRLSFCHWIFFALLLKLLMNGWGYFWASDSTLLINLSISTPIPHYLGYCNLSWNQVILDLQTCHCRANWLVSSRSLAFAHEF